LGEDRQVKLILASSSIYRQKLLARLNIPFSVEPSKVDEDQYKADSPSKLSEALAIAKAEAVALKFPQDLIIGSDQLAECEGVILGKPHTKIKHEEQLRFLSGKTHSLHTAVCLIGPKIKKSWVHETKISFRKLTDTEIKNYVNLEEALDCSGGYKIESFGISLMSKIETTDPTAIEGLPLLRLHEELKNYSL
jgi:septum formation protein